MCCASLVNLNVFLLVYINIFKLFFVGGEDSAPFRLSVICEEGVFFLLSAGKERNH